MIKIITPPLKSQGIKTKLVPQIMKMKPAFYDRWIEPFLGTGVVAFNSKSEKALLSDINPHIINFYSKLQSGEINSITIKEFLEMEGRKLSTAENGGVDYYKFVRDRFNSHYDSLDFLFLSRAGFNGMIRFNRKGNWNIPFCKKPERFCTSYITKIVHQAENCKNQITKDWKFETKDFRQIFASASENDFIYCDPPYAGRYSDYYSNWTEDDEEDLFKLLSKTKAKFILSSWHHNDFRYNDNIKKYEKAFNVITQEHFYFAGAKEANRNPIVEALIYNYDLEIQSKSEAESQYSLFPESERKMA